MQKEGSVREVHRLALKMALKACPLPKTVLDIGCGDGSFTQALSLVLPSAVVTGIDLELPSSIKASSRLSFEVGTAENLPFGEESFDLITSCLSLHHWKNKQRGIEQAYRVLRKGGQLILGDPLIQGWLENRFLGWLVQKIDSGVFATTQELMSYLETAGFASIGVEIVPQSFKSLFVISAIKPRA